MSINHLKFKPPFDSESYAEKLIKKYNCSIAKDVLAYNLTHISEAIRKDDYLEAVEVTRGNVKKILNKDTWDDSCEQLYNEIFRIIERNYIEDTELDKAVNKSIENYVPGQINKNHSKKELKINIAWIIICVAIVIVTILLSIPYLVSIFETANTIGGGKWIIGIIVLPLAIFGGIQIFRGFAEMCDSGKINSTISVILTISGYIALFYAISKF